MNKKISIIIPCYNEEDNIELLYEKLNNTLIKIDNFNFEYLFIDDGSTDSTLIRLMKLSNYDNKLKIISLSRNFGIHASITAGIENVIESECVIIISADLQEPPEKISEMIELWKIKNEVVWAIRKKRSQSFLSKFFSTIFYKFFIKGSGLKNYPIDGPACFFLLDKNSKKKLYILTQNFIRNPKIILRKPCVHFKDR